MMSISQSILQKTKMTFYVESNKTFCIIHRHSIPSFAYEWKHNLICKDIVLNGKDVEYEIMWPNEGSTNNWGKPQL